MLYLCEVGFISMHMGFFLIIRPILQSLPIAADKTWSFIVFPVLENEATSPTPLTIPKYLNATSVPCGNKALQLDSAKKDDKTIIFFLIFNFPLVVRTLSY